MTKFFSLSLFGAKMIVVYTDGVMGCEMGNGKFSEESNFQISCIKMKIKIKGSEAGWIVGITDVLGEEGQQ